MKHSIAYSFRFFTFIAIMFIGVNVTAQHQDVLNQSYSKESIYTFDNRYTGVLGSPYLFEDWKKATLTIKNSKTQEPYSVSDISVKIDAHTHKVFVRPNKSNLVLELDQGIRTITLYGETDSINIIQRLINDKLSFTQNIYEGEVTIVKHFVRKFREADYEGAYSAGRTYDEFKVDDMLYVVVGNDLIKVKSNKKFWIGLFPDKKSEIAAYLKKNELKMDIDFIDFATSVFN